MIAPLRRVHRGVFAGLALLLPSLLASAWKVRADFPRRPIPPELRPGPVERPGGEPLGDVLVYWTASVADGVTGLPADAEFVGTLRSGALEQPLPAGRRAIGFDLAHGETVELSAEPSVKPSVKLGGER